ncbi:hypothetical protein [Streptomyces katrae]|uniref:hypothetical protein n=1 Tax=Streptomyces katrae TaxID=68223 RepID=UPI0012FE9D61|nr:hypothetical protein [Streptomyces katrae]
MELRRMIEVLAEEAEREIHDQAWAPTPADRALAAKAAADLHQAIGTPHAQQALPATERLERLREVLAVLAVASPASTDAWPGSSVPPSPP